MNPLIYGGDAPHVISDDGLVAYATENDGRTIWTACPINGAHIHSSGSSAGEALANWRRRHGDPALYIGRLAA